MGKKSSYRVCSYANCPYLDKMVDIESENAIRIGTRYKHKTCDEISNNCIKIRDTYVNNVSNSVVMAQLCGVIKNLVFKKLRDDDLSPEKSALKASEYLLFALNYAINNHMRIRNPLSLHYLIDNQRVKKAWEEKNSQVIEKEIMKSPIDFSGAKTTDYVMPEKIKNNPYGFENIFN